MRSLRVALAVAAVGTVLVAAVLLARGPNATTPTESQAPTASGAAAASATPSATAVPSASAPIAGRGAVPNDDFGFMVFASGSFAIRAESSETRIATVQQSVLPTVSADGRQIAYWRTGTDLAAPWELRTFSVSSPDRQQTLLTLAADQRGGTIRWSDDASALVFATQRGNFGIGGGANSATLETFDLRGTTSPRATIASQANTGRLYVPIGWSRTTNVVGAAESGEGGFMSAYLVVRVGAPGDTVTRTALSGQNSIGRASSDAKLVLNEEALSRALRWWPLADYAAGSTVGASAGDRTLGAAWRPGTHQIGWVAGPRLELFDADWGTVSATASAPTGFHLTGFRVDGSAAMIAAQSAGDVTVVDLASGASAALRDQFAFGPSVRLR